MSNASDTPSNSLGALLHTAIESLRATSDSARLDAEVLLERATGLSRSIFRIRPELPLSPKQIAEFRSLIERRRLGEPIAYILGEREFWSLSFSVTPDVLIPRPDTETLVECALRAVPEELALEVLDLGTGSGAVALAIASERPLSQVTATDGSPVALALARRNARRLGLSNVRFLEGLWFEPVAGRRFALIVSNPPYLAAADPHLGHGDVRYEPRAALVAGPTGLEALSRITTQALPHLLVNGWLWLEHGHEQAAAVRNLLDAAGFEHVATERDLGGRERVSGGRRA